MDWGAAKENLLGTCTQVFDDGGWVHHPVGGAATPVPAVYREHYESVDPDTGVPVTERRPHIGVRLSDLGAEPRAGSGQPEDLADEFDGRGSRWRVYDSQVDGEGGATLFLHKIA